MNYITTDTWNEFAKAVQNHIKNYTIPQYGNYPEDPVTNMTNETIKANMDRYRNRIGKNQRGLNDSILDCYKIAHYLQILKAREEGTEGERLSNWKDFARRVLKDLMRDNVDDFDWLTLDEFNFLFDSVSRWRELTQKNETRIFKPYDVVQHKKGNYYIVIGYGAHTETQEPFVVYKSLKSNEHNRGDFYLRPKSMFEDGRFTLVKEGEIKNV